MDWNFLPPEIHDCIFAELSNLEDFSHIIDPEKVDPKKVDPGDSKIHYWRSYTRKTWRSIVNYLLVCRTWSHSIESTVIRNNQAATVLHYANDRIALKAVKRLFQTTHSPQSTTTAGSKTENVEDNKNAIVEESDKRTLAQAVLLYNDPLGTLLATSTLHRLRTCTAFLQEQCPGINDIHISRPEYGFIFWLLVRAECQRSERPIKSPTSQGTAGKS
ncbi:hypothetical protein FQN55_001627 [Onygenales sp. PD_40]|nr:hypothetical protein FQN55_001627 [Onygenales sp. PD_40]KAK2788841.1 hypothetical protein FQN53_003028 [Emmonsiellopsis sp. PD_33]KAK2794413.1 hypothetical protein FQN51_000856 [Onygenales sp. PD_10]